MGKKLGNFMQAGDFSPNKPPKGMPAGGPTPPPPDLTPQQLVQQRQGVTGAGEAPMFLGLSSGMTPLQQRTAIATGATSSEQGGYNDPEALKYYRKLLLTSLVGDNGAISPYSEVTPVEQEFLKTLGQTPQAQSTESFISALDRAIG